MHDKNSSRQAPNPNKSIKAWLLRLAIVAGVLIPAQVGEYWLAGVAGVVAIPILLMPLSSSVWAFAAYLFVLAMGAGLVMAGLVGSSG